MVYVKNDLDHVHKLLIFTNCFPGILSVDGTRRFSPKDVSITCRITMCLRDAWYYLQNYNVTIALFHVDGDCLCSLCGLLALHTLSPSTDNFPEIGIFISTGIEWGDGPGKHSALPTGTDFLERKGHITNKRPWLVFPQRCIRCETIFCTAAIPLITPIHWWHLFIVNDNSSFGVFYSLEGMWAAQVGGFG